MNETMIYAMPYIIASGLLLVSAVVTWVVLRRRSAGFRLEIERNRALGLYDDVEFKQRTRLLTRVRSIAVLIIVLLAAVPLFAKLSDPAWTILVVIGLILFVVNHVAALKWRKLMQEGIKK